MFPATIMLSETFITYYENLEKTEQPLVKKSVFRLANRLISKGMGLKKLNKMSDEVWECRCSRNYRILMISGNGCDFTLVYVGSHDDTSKIYSNTKKLPDMFNLEDKIIFTFEEYFNIQSDEIEKIEENEDSDVNLTGGKLFGQFSLRKIKKLFSEEDMFLLNEVLDLETKDELDELKNDLSPDTFAYLTWTLSKGIDDVLSVIDHNGNADKAGNVKTEEEIRLEKCPYVALAKKITQSETSPNQLFVANSDPCAYKAAMAMLTSSLSGVSLKKGSGKSIYICSEKSHILDVKSLYKYLQKRYGVNTKGREDVSFYTPIDILRKTYDEIKDKAGLDFKIFDYTEDCTLFMNVLSRYKKECSEKYDTVSLEDLFYEWQCVCCRFNAFTEELYRDAPRLDVRYDLKDQMLVLIPALIDKMKSEKYYEMGYASYILRNACNKKAHHPYTDVFLVEAIEMYPCFTKFAEALTDSKNNVQYFFSQTQEMRSMYRDRAVVYYYDRRSVLGMVMTAPTIGNESTTGTSSCDGDLSIRFFKDMKDRDEKKKSLSESLSIYFDYLTEDAHMDDFDSSAILVFSNDEVDVMCRYLQSKHLPCVRIDDETPALKAYSEKGIKVCTYRRARYLLFSYVFAVDSNDLGPFSRYDIDPKLRIEFENNKEEFISSKCISLRYDQKGFFKYMMYDQKRK